MKSTVGTSKTSKTADTRSLHTRCVDAVVSRLQCAANVAEVVLSYNKCCNDIKDRDFAMKFHHIKTTKHRSVFCGNSNVCKSCKYCTVLPKVLSK